MMSKIEMIFLGTGTSEGVPRVSCLTRNPVECEVCRDALRPNSRNWRANTSLLLRFNGQDCTTKTVLIDAGKFFYYSAIKWFPRYSISMPDAVVLTHAHADAAGGLDSLRDWTNVFGVSIPVYYRKEDETVLTKTAYYLMERSNKHSAGTVAKLEFKEIPPRDHFEPVEGLHLQPLLVEHGKGFTANGYRFEEVCYVSDVSGFPERTWKKMQGCRVLVVDALRKGKMHGSHLGIDQAIDTAIRLKPRRVLFIGMSHGIEHYSENKRVRDLLANEGIEASLAYDGQRIEVTGR